MLKNVAPGEVISAAQWNEMVNVVRQFQQLQGDGFIKVFGNNIGLNLDLVLQQVNRCGPDNNPSTLGAASEGSETASADTWKRDIPTSGTNYGNTALDIWVITRVVYNDAGDKKLYSYTRKLSFDLLGHLYAVSAETRITVDVPEAC